MVGAPARRRQAVAERHYNLVTSRMRIRATKSKTAHHTAKCNVPLSISWHEIKHKVAKNYRTHDHKQPEKRPTDASSSRPRQPEKHILAKQHEIKQFVAKKILWNLRHFCRFRHSVA